MKNLGRSFWWTALLLLMWFENNVTGTDDENYNEPSRSSRQEDAEVPRSRQKRLLWITTDGRLALPPGTRLTLTPSLSLPFVRYPPDGFLSNMSISLPFTSQYNDKIYYYTETLKCILAMFVFCVPTQNRTK